MRDTERWSGAGSMRRGAAPEYREIRAKRHTLERRVESTFSLRRVLYANCEMWRPDNTAKHQFRRNDRISQPRIARRSGELET